jgi:stage II sporulation protein P
MSFKGGKKRIFSTGYKWVKLVMLLACLLLVTGVARNINMQPRLALKYLGTSGLNGENIIREMLPSPLPAGEQSIGKLFLQQMMLAVTGISSSDPASILGCELNIPWDQVAAALSSPVELEGGEEDFYLPNDSSEEAEPPSAEEIQFPPVQLNGEPMILIYNTHNAETYKPSDGVSKLEGKNAGVAAVAKTMTMALESKHSLRTIYCDVIHDYPDWTKSYINSMSTLQNLLKSYKKLQMVIDIHRDAGLERRGDTLVKIGGKEYAKIMIVVGNEHPNWKQNLAFAEKLAARAERMYPGLIKSVRVAKDRRYNQHLHPRALLFEMGSELNTRQDANNSAVLMAEVIAAVLKDS